MQALYLEIKNLIINTLNLDELTADDIDTEAALFGDGLGLDSIDALELGLAVKTSTVSCYLLKAKRCANTSIPSRPWPRLSIPNAPENAFIMTEHTNQNAIYQEVSALLCKLFEIDADSITPESRLYEDLELDSIDAVDMIVHVQKKTGKKINRKNLKLFARCRML